MSTHKQAKTAFEYLLSHDHRVKLKYDPKPFWNAFDNANRKLATHNSEIKYVSWPESHDDELNVLAPKVISSHEGSFVFTTDSSVTRGIAFGTPIKLMIVATNKESLEWLKSSIHDSFKDILAKGVASKIEKLTFGRMKGASDYDIKIEGSFKFFEFPLKLAKMPKVVKK